MQYHTILERSILAAMPNIPRSLVLLFMEFKKLQCMAGDPFAGPTFLCVPFRVFPIQERHFVKISKTIDFICFFNHNYNALF